MRDPKRLPAGWHLLATLLPISSLLGQAEENPPLRISEIRPRGNRQWIELVNEGPGHVVPQEYSLEIKNVRGRDLIPRGSVDLPEDTAIPPGGYYRVCLTEGGDPRCLDADMDRDGGLVSLWWHPPCEASRRQRVDSVRYPPLPGGTSYGRYGDRLCVLAALTPGEPNAPCDPDQELTPFLLNEVSTTDGGQLEIGGRSPDWVELHNSSPEPVDLGGYRLISRDDSLVFPAGLVLDPDRYLLVILDEVVGPADHPHLQAPFALSRNGDPLVLRSPGGREARLALPFLHDGEVFTRDPVTGEWFPSSCATPRKRNRERDDCSNERPFLELLDRFPLRVLPGDPIEVIVKITDRNDDVESARLRWWPAGKRPRQGELVTLTPAKRTDCNRNPEEGVFGAVIPPLPAPGVLLYRIEVKDRGGWTEFEEKRVRVQDPAFSLSHPLRINEIAASEEILLPGGDTRPGNWVEIHNTSPPGTSAARLRGLFLTDSVFEVRQERRFSFDVLSIPAGEKRLVWCDGKNLNFGAEPHLPFRLNRCRDQVILYDADGETVIDAVEFHEEKPRASLGRLPDGGEILSLMEPTPGEPNRQASCRSFGLEVGAPGGDLVINELCADNWASAHDGRFEYGDWIEIYNRGPSRIPLRGWKLRDRGKKEDKSTWEFPARLDGEPLILAPGEHLLVWCDNDADCENGLDGELHTDFELNRLGDLVELIAPDNTIVDHVQGHYQARDVSIGRFPSGADRMAFLVPTPGGQNEAGVTEAIAPTECDVPSLPCAFLRADADQSGKVEITDAILLLGYLFLGGPPPLCLDAGDADDGGTVNLTDAVYILSYLFQGGPGPLPPFPGPGPDPTDDAMSCREPCLAARPDPQER